MLLSYIDQTTYNSCDNVPFTALHSTLFLSGVCVLHFKGKHLGEARNGYLIKKPLTARTAHVDVYGPRRRLPQRDYRVSGCRLYTGRFCNFMAAQLLMYEALL